MLKFAEMAGVHRSVEQANLSKTIPKYKNVGYEIVTCVGILRMAMLLFFPL
jgi:hypothetical protein